MRERAGRVERERDRVADAITERWIDREDQREVERDHLHLSPVKKKVPLSKTKTKNKTKTAKIGR